VNVIYVFIQHIRRAKLQEERRSEPEKGGIVDWPGEINRPDRVSHRADRQQFHQRMNPRIYHQPPNQAKTVRQFAKEAARPGGDSSVSAVIIRHN
jgi:hypothetical protein